MIDDFQLQGNFWLPETSDRKVSGTLKFNPEEGATLELIGSLEDIKTGPIGIWERDIILGFSTNGKYITLNRCLETNKNISMPGMISQVIHADRVFLGSHLDKSEDIKFKNILARFSHLDEWVNLSGFDIKYEFVDKKPTKVNIEYKRPEPIDLVSLNDYKISIHFESNWPLGALTDLKMKQRTVLKIESNGDSKSFFDWMNIVGTLQDFLTLGSFTAVYPIFIAGELYNGGQDVKASEKKTPPRIEVFYSLINKPDLTKKLTPFDMLFTYGDISSDLSKYLTNWINKSESLKPVYDYFFSTIYTQRLYIEHRFLNLIGAVEFYHRRTSGGKYQTDDEYRNGLYKQLVDSIPGGLPDDFKDSLKARFFYLNEYSLRKRLREVLRNHWDIISFKIDNAGAFTEDVVNTRNFFIHQDPSLQDKSKSGVEIHKMCEKLKLLIVVCFLSEMEIPPDAIRHFVSGNKRLSAA